jgi:hypothetical protein
MIFLQKFVVCSLSNKCQFFGENIFKIGPCFLPTYDDVAEFFKRGEI